MVTSTCHHDLSAWYFDQHALPFFPTHRATTEAFPSEQPLQYFAVLSPHTFHLSCTQVFLPVYFLWLIIELHSRFMSEFCEKMRWVKTAKIRNVQNTIIRDLLTSFSTSISSSISLSFIPSAKNWLKTNWCAKRPIKKVKS